MSTSREGPNPLRPYYRPPSIGLPQDTPGATSSGTHGLGPKNGSAASYASSARDIFSDVDYSDYFSSDSAPSGMESVQKMFNDNLYRYFSVLLSQPFDVGKTVLQVRSQGAAGTTPVSVAEDVRSRASSYRGSVYSDDQYGSDSDPDEPAYFTSSAPSAHSYTPSRSRRRNSDRSLSPPPRSPKTIPPSHQLSLKRADSLLEVISQEWTKEGAWGVWKATNATFIHSLLLTTLENWSRGVFSAIFNVPDPGAIVGLGAVTDVIDTPYPWASLGVAVAASVVTGLLLAPLDLVRTKLILSPVSDPNRSLTYNLRTLPSYFCPTALIIPTALHNLITPTIAHSTPLMLRSHLAIDPVLTPTAYSLCKFLSRVVELFIKLPFETVLRRGQMAVLSSQEYSATGGPNMQTMVEVGPYRGVFGTMWSIVREEGTSSQEMAVGAGAGKMVKRGKKPERKGQGIEGLWRGWRVGMWGLIGVWSAKAMSSSNTGGEF